MSGPDIGFFRTQTASARASVASLRSWTARRWVIAIMAGVVAALAMGVPTGVVDTTLYSRMTPVTWWNDAVWAISALLIGLLAATYVRAAAPPPVDRTGRTLGAALLSTFAIGCPICNKLVVALIGVTGAMDYWAPMQPVLGVLGIGLLAKGLMLRLGGAISCPSAPTL